MRISPSLSGSERSRALMALEALSTSTTSSIDALMYFASAVRERFTSPEKLQPA